MQMLRNIQKTRLKKFWHMGFWETKRIMLW